MEKNNAPIIGGILLMIFSTLLLIGLIVYAFRVDALAGVSPYDVLPTPTISSPTIIYDSPLSNSVSDTPDTDNNVILPLPEGIDKDMESPNQAERIRPDNFGSNTFDRDIARRERKIICHFSYQEHKEKVINHDKVVERCATMLTLQWAFESGHGKSNKCINQKNCLGIKNNRRDRCIRSNNGFCTYSAHIEGMRDFAEMFMKHYEGYKSVRAYLDVYAPDGNGAYPRYVMSKYDETLNYFLEN